METTGFAQRVTLAKVLAAWESSQIHCKKVAETHAEQDMRLEPKLLPASEIQGMRRAFQAKHWKLESTEVPSRQYLERLRDQLEKNEYTVEKLSEVTDRESQDPDTAKITFTAGGDMRSVKAKSERPLPRNSEELRSRVVLMGTAWIMVSLSQGGTNAASDVTPQLWQDYLKYLLGEKVAQLGFKDPATGNHMGTAPSWRLLLSYELSIRRKALEDVTDGMTYGAALRAAWKDSETKQVHFTTPLALELAMGRQKGGGGSGSGSSGLHFPPALAGMPPQRALDDEPAGESKRQAQKRKEAERKAAAKRKAEEEAAAAAKKQKKEAHARTPDGKQLCFAYNGGKGCKKNGCKSLHACRICFGEHSMRTCNK